MILARLAARRRWVFAGLASILLAAPFLIYMGASASPGLPFSDGFESGDFSRWSSLTVTGDGSAAVQQQTVWGGLYSARLSTTSSSSSKAYVRKAVSDADIHADGRFNIPTESASGCEV